MINHHVVRTAHPTIFGSCDASIERRVRRAHHQSSNFNAHGLHHAPQWPHQAGFTLIELLVATTLAALLIVGLGGVVGQVTVTRDAIQDRNELTRQARFAMEQMVRAVSHSRLLLLPLNDTPSTDWPEHIREQTVPPSPPIGSSTLATAVLAVTLPADQDLDGDGFADADDDRDGRIDEDPPEDIHYDAAAGVYQIDDGGDGFVDEGPDADDDEAFLTSNEDPVNNADDDGDSNADEDPPDDNNGDGCPGVCGVDDDGDGSIDEGGVGDDDEDGQQGEDWYNAVVFHLNGSTLVQRTPVPWDETGAGGITGRDFISSDIASNVSRFRVERVAGVANNEQLVDITLDLTSPATGEIVSLQTQVRIGGAL